MRGYDAVKFNNISATTLPFVLRGGRYSIGVVATFGGGSVGLEALANDDTTWIAALPGGITANGFAHFYKLPMGTYRFSITTATAVYATISCEPED